MMNLMGSEKQVKWAEEIREWYAEKAVELVEIEAIIRNLEKEGPNYTYNIDRNQQSTIYIVAQQLLGMGQRLIGKWTDERYDQLEAEGVERKGRGRLAEADLVKMVREELESRLESEESAKYWIDIRPAK